MLTKIYKLIFDISLSYTIGAFLLKYFAGVSISLISFLILVLTAIGSILLEKKKTIKHMVMALIPAAYLIWMKPSIPELLVFLTIWAYYAYVTITERFVTRRDEFVYKLKRFSLFFVVLVFFIFNHVSKFIISIEAAGPYLATCLVTVIFLLRHLRAVNQMEEMKSYRRQQLIELILFLLICFFLTLAKAPQNLAFGLKLLYHYVISPIIGLIGYIVGSIILGILYLVFAIIGLITNNKEMKSIELPIGGAADKTVELVEHFQGNNLSWLVPLLYSIGIIAGLVILFFFFRRLMGDKFKLNTPDGILETRESIEDGKDKKKKYEKRRPKESRAAVRYYYGKYLLWIQHKKVKLRVQDTTDDIHSKYQRALMDDGKDNQRAAEELKQLYHKSRYNISEEISPDEVEKAKQSYKKIKSSKLLKE